MIVSDIYPDLVDFLGSASQPKVFSLLSDAIELLANKGQWDPLLAYVNIAVTSDYLVTLPPQVEVPIRLNMNGNPSFPRDRGYEFTMNGPGSNDPRLGWTWEDQGDDASGNRILRLSQKAVAVRALVRLKTTKITAMTQFIPLHSKMAIILMTKALQAYKRGTPEEMQLGQAFEASAEKFIKEEQSSRDIFKTVSAQIDLVPIMGFNYHTPDLVQVSDLYDSASEIVGGAGRGKVFDAIMEAQKILTTKAPFDSLLAYLDIYVPTSGIVTLPRDVDTPIRININGNPSFTRTKLYEFSLNGPGSEWNDVTSFTWMEQGFSPVMAQPNVPSQVKISGIAGDVGKHVTVYGIDANNKEINNILTVVTPVALTSLPLGPSVFKKITRVAKDVTSGPVQLYAANGNLLSTYYGDEVEPNYRQIRISGGVTAAKILFKKANRKVISLYDFIPLRSKTAMLLMMRALKLYNSATLTADLVKMAMALEEQAAKYLNEDQQALEIAAGLTQNEVQPAYGINYRNSDSIVVADIIDDAADIFGQIGKQKLYDKITDASEIMNNKGQWDGLIGYVDIFTNNERYITLPRWVEVPVAINTSPNSEGEWASPTEMRNSYFQFHMNGPGSDWTPIRFWDDEKDAVVIVTPKTAQPLFAICDLNDDTDVRLRVFGFDLNGNAVRTINPDTGNLEDGCLVPVALTPAPASELSQGSPGNPRPAFKIITRITKGDSLGFIRLYARDVAAGISTLLGNYYPDETEPHYRRIKINESVKFIRMKYRKRTLKVTNLGQPLHLKSKQSIVTAMRSMAAMTKDPNLAEALETKAIDYLTQEQNSRNPSETFITQHDTRTAGADPLQGQY